MEQFILIVVGGLGAVGIVLLGLLYWAASRP